MEKETMCQGYVRTSKANPDITGTESEDYGESL